MRLFTLIIFSWIFLSCGHADDKMQVSRPLAKTNVLSLMVGTSRLTVEVAKSEDERRRGLMQRRHLAPHAGMLFIFDQVVQPCLWMKDTLIPLSAAYIDNTGLITQIENLTALSQQRHCAQFGTRYIIEANQGWFQNHHVVVGTTRIDNLPAQAVGNLSTP